VFEGGIPMLIRATMLVKDQLITASSEDSVEFALNQINSKNFLSIPVVDGEKFVGVVSKEKIYEEYFYRDGDKEEFLKNTRVREIARFDIPVLKPQDELEKAAYNLEVYGVPFIAVVNDNDEFQGIVTHHAIFREFTDAMGINRGKRLTIISYDLPGQIAKLTEIIHKCNGDIISFVILDPKVMTDVKEIVVRIRTDNFVEIVDAVRDAGFRVQ
jgi:acetoin utilization protein AcuB